MRIVDCSDGLDFRLIDSLVRRTETTSGTDAAVAAILTEVRDHGDAALARYSLEFDGFDLSACGVVVEPADIRRYAANARPELVVTIRQAAANIRRFHERQLQQSWEFDAGDGIRLGLRFTAIDRAGVYVPGGTASYPSSVLMNVIPAQVAGVSGIAVVTPPRALEENPLVAAAIAELGITEVYRIGGAQSIAALAYGTPSVPRVDKIVGPGNQYVQAAKRMVYGLVDIDMIAGPSEVAVIADESCDPAWAAADLLAQAEHDEMAGVWLICRSAAYAQRVVDCLRKQLRGLERSAIAEAAVRDNALAFVVKDNGDIVRLVNHLAAEHVEVLTDRPDELASLIRNAGAIFCGRYSPTAIGDYFAGPNHVLPTGRTARFFSALGVPDFQKRTSVVHYSREAIEKNGSAIEAFANSEGLTGHARSVSIRRD